MDRALDPDYLSYLNNYIFHRMTQDFLVFV